MSMGGGPNTPGNGPGNLSWDAQSPLAWASPNNQGASAVVGAGQTEVGVADLRAPAWCTGRDITVVLGINVEGDPERFIVNDDCVEDGSANSTLIDSWVQAVLRWQVGSASFEACCDWLNGTRIIVPAAQVQIYANYTQLVGSAADAAQRGTLGAPNFRVQAGYTLGSTGKNSNPARLTRAVQMGPLGTQRVMIPPFATSFALQITVGSSTTAIADVYGFGTGYKVRYTATAIGSNVNQYNVENAFPLRNGAKFIDIVNPSAIDNLRAFVIFGLAL